MAEKKPVRSEHRVPHVAVLVDTATGWGRRLVRGISNYAKMHGPWNIYIEPRGRDERLKLPVGWDGDGVIARISNKQMAEQMGLPIPVVNVSSIEIEDAVFPRVTTDFNSRAKLALEHFVERGHYQFGYFSLQQRNYVRQHRVLFEHLVKERGYECHSFSHPSGWSQASWERQQECIGEWLCQLPKPIALLTWGTTAGIEVINACHDFDVVVPGDIAVLGGDDDDLLCQACFPPLSGTEVPSEQVGFEAARLLDGYMSGALTEPEMIQIEPTGIIARQSTDAYAIDDQELVEALRYIRSNANQVLRVGEVVEAVNVSRRSLERRVRKLLGRSLRDEIAKTHLERATMLLATTDMSIPQVARASGYGSAEYFATVFRQSRGLSPIRFRAKLRGERADAEPLK